VRARLEEKGGCGGKRIKGGTKPRARGSVREGEDTLKQKREGRPVR